MKRPSDREAVLETLLSEGLDLCVRARQLDEKMDRAMMDAIVEPYGTKCATPALWLRDQYDKDLADWEKRAREFLLPPWMAKPQTRDISGE